MSISRVALATFDLLRRMAPRGPRADPGPHDPADQPDRVGRDLMEPLTVDRRQIGRRLGQQRRPDAYRTMYAEFAEAIQLNQMPKLDVGHGLRLQRVIESAETEALQGS